MTEPIPGGDGGDLASALRHAFDEAGNPSLAAVAHAAPGVSKQRLSDWRAGRHVPARFEDLEPVIAYLRIAASGLTTAEADDTASGTSDWTPERWREVWRQSVDLSADAHADANGAADVDAAEPVREVDRKPIAIAVVSVIVVLVAALAVMAYLLSWATM
ncbi:hypothetical protein [Tsukamurella pseudospumae]|uniref:Uncharacterized protein n=1 Tax=Tsukamurella pseudospumae TaxID=239498 RepID=A0A137ZZ75_9ACTN|nr:hypothetical protein [Tsukamurella pseudospumae]KXO98026.1 hypothetical protein AXK61_20915 [Tsukamurella pseudospumae]KXP03498.1 hypothetical protein AXK60_16905 [Tsukamurella pseudospumae]